VGATGGGDEENARRFRPDKGFQGVDYSAAAQAAADGQPVQFERDAPEADPFGLDQFLTDVSRTASRSR
jgi:SNW domain-containing protein 1